jgi:hypothetical protein
MGDADLLDNQVGKVGKNGHRLESNQETVLLEAFIWFFSISHLAATSLRESSAPLADGDRLRQEWKRCFSHLPLLPQVLIPVQEHQE